MAAGGSASFCFLIVCFLVCSSEALEIIRAELGQEVILPCKVPSKYNIKTIVVEWSRPGMNTEHVLLCRNGRFDPDNQHPSYKNRVDLQDKEMKDGNVSLILNNVTMEDNGKYMCFVYENAKNECININYLEVLLSAQTNIGAEKITAELGQEVILPCKASKKNNNINTITAVEWIRPDLDPGYVLIYRDGRFDPDNQHPSYQNRVDLQDKEMKDGNVSLILKNVTKNDTGTYECWIYQRNKFEPISIINLEVLLPGDGIIILYIVGGIAFLLVVAAVGFWLYKRHRRQNQHHPVPPVQPTPVEMPPVPEVPPEQPTASEPLMKRPAEEQTEM